MRIDRWSENVRWIARFALGRGQRHRYGHERSQFGELHLPRRDGPHPVVVLIHGGSWRKRFGLKVMRAVAAELVGRGYAVWNVEYRRVGEEGGGWPATFADVAAAIDLLDGLHPALDLERVDVLGHSAGGHLALWAMGREKLAAGAPGAIAGRARVRLRRAVSLAGVCDLEGAYRDWHGGAVRALMGGSPKRLPDRYEAADPMHQLPPTIPVLLVHGVEDETVSVRLSRDYARAANATGGEVELVEIDGEAGRHRAFVHPRGAAWAPVLSWLGQSHGSASAGAGAAIGGAG